MSALHHRAGGWKDESDFAEAMERGTLDRSLDAILRREVDDVLALLDAERGPFAPRWRAWRPLIALDPPVLPADVERE